MEKVFIGSVSTTHGIKGELRVRSDFKYKEEVFVKGIKVYIGNDLLTIFSVRNHKEYKLIMFEGYNNINDVLKYRGKDIYIDRNLINSNYILQEDIIGFNVLSNDKNLGILTDIITNGAHEILVIGDIMIPYIDKFIKNIDFSKKEIHINEIEGLIE